LSVGIILAITAYFIYEIWQLDVKTKLFYEEDNQGCMEDTTMVLSIQRMLERFANFSILFNN
jgi:hypothetical protein